MFKLGMQQRAGKMHRMAFIIVTGCIPVSMGSRRKVFENEEEAFHSGKSLKNLTEQLKLIKKKTRDKKK
ncbi:hypothetical protein V1478_017837 [Vespula squamosa]|uniref:Uncharacterized protein n=1 Tax=Vespula squamosa TaxID=30214 RepID=A0ABD1ZVD0_VESSQ